MKLTDIGFFWKFDWILDKNFVRFFGYRLIDYVSINFNSKVTYAHINNNSLFA
jgi:hypothetical protein